LLQGSRLESSYRGNLNSRRALDFKEDPSPGTVLLHPREASRTADRGERMHGEPGKVSLLPSTVLTSATFVIEHAQASAIHWLGEYTSEEKRILVSHFELHSIPYALAAYSRSGERARLGA
jgi:hypothetical protein